MIQRVFLVSYRYRSWTASTRRDRWVFPPTHDQFSSNKTVDCTRGPGRTELYPISSQHCKLKPWLGLCTLTLACHCHHGGFQKRCTSSSPPTLDGRRNNYPLPRFLSPSPFSRKKCVKCLKLIVAPLDTHEWRSKMGQNSTIFT